MSFRIILILFVSLLGNVFGDCCGLPWVSPYVYDLILKEEILTCKETRVIIPVYDTTQPFQDFYQVASKYIQRHRSCRGTTICNDILEEGIL